jgi:death-on-curing protein
VKLITEEEIIGINAYIIARFSPAEEVGIKEPESLNAIVQSQNQELFGVIMFPTIFDKASALLVGLCQKHVFGNANKRTAWLSTVVFLSENDIRLLLNTEQGLELVMNVVTSKTEREALLKLVSDKLEEYAQ